MIRSTPSKAIRPPPTIVNMRRNIRLSTLSAIRPEKTPSRKSGTILRAAASPTMNAESVFSKTIQPRATLSIPNPIDWKKVDTHKYLKSLNWKDCHHCWGLIFLSEVNIDSQAIAKENSRSVSANY